MKEKIVMKMVLEIMITSEKKSFITKGIKDSIKLNFGYDLTAQNISSIFNKLKETTNLIESSPYHGRGFQYKLVDIDQAILYFEELKNSDDVKNSLLNLISKDEFNTSSQILGLYCSGRGKYSERMNFTLTGIIRFIIKEKSYIFNVANIVSMLPGAFTDSTAIVSNISYMKKLGMIVDANSGFLGLSDGLKSEILKRMPKKEPVEDEVVYDLVKPEIKTVDADAVATDAISYIEYLKDEYQKLHQKFTEVDKKYQDLHFKYQRVFQENLNFKKNKVSVEYTPVSVLKTRAKLF